MNDGSQAGGVQPDAPAGAKNPNAAAEPKNTDDTAAQPQKSDKQIDPRTAAWSGGVNEEKIRNLARIGGVFGRDFASGDEMLEYLRDVSQKSKEAEEIKGKLEKPETLPAVQNLQKEIDKYKRQVEERDSMLQKHKITDAIETLAAKAENPRVARVLFLEEHKVKLNEKGEVEVRTLDGMPVFGNDGSTLGLQAAFNQWFGKQLGLQKASDKSGSGALGGGDSEGQKKFTPEAIRNMTLAEYQKNKPEILAQIKADQQKG